MERDHEKEKNIETIGVFQKGLDVNSIQLSFANHLHYSLLHDLGTGKLRDFYNALALVARDRVVERWMHSQQIHQEKDAHCGVAYGERRGGAP